MLTVRMSTLFKKDYKRLNKRGFDLRKLDSLIQRIATGEPLPPKYKDHLLINDYAGCHECHITPDWLLVYEIWKNELILYLTRTGTHSDIF